jgi:hypothetical protein
MFSVRRPRLPNYYMPWQDARLQQAGLGEEILAI